MTRTTLQNPQHHDLGCVDTLSTAGSLAEGALALTGRSVVSAQSGVASFGGRSGVALALFGPPGGKQKLSRAS